MAYPETIAHLVTKRRGMVWAAVGVIALVSIGILITRLTLDTEVLNLLPRGFPSVEGLKLYNSEFAQTRELTFALLCEPNDVEKLEEFASVFADRLHTQPWCARLLTGSPMETPEGVHDLQAMAAPLLLNLEPAAFAETISVLEPAKMQQRLHRLKQEIEAGSPKPQLELQLDPLGVIAPALRPFVENRSIEQDQPLASADRTMRILLVVTNQATTSAFDCQKLMREVDAFQKTANEGWDGGPLQILVTGRSAYASEISLSMRHDIVATLLGSVLLVGIVFYVGFHRWMPLLGMGISLLLCCLVALAVGILIFGELNMVTVGFCAILIGLGVDFAILIFGRYQQARDEGKEHSVAVAESIRSLGRAIFFGALTTAVGFLALLLANSGGFTQLGVLIAIGISLAGLFMTTVFFLLIPRRSKPRTNDRIFEWTKRYVRQCVHRPRRVLTISVPILVVMTAIAISPRPQLPFDGSTRSMEPTNSRASYALHTIMNKLPTRWEPVTGIIRANNAQQLHDYWSLVESHWRDLQQRGIIKGFSTPAALAISPKRMEENRSSLSHIDFVAARTALDASIAAEGFSADGFSSGHALLDELQKMSDSTQPIPDWRSRLGPTSSWWFLVDRYFAHNPMLTTGFVTTNAPVETPAQKIILDRELPVPGVPMILSGWSFTLTDLLPWSHRQLLLITGLMAIFDATLLALLYRDWRLWLIQIATLIMAIGGMIATMKLLNIPLNLLNVLAFRLVLAIGVDYGIYVLLVWQKARELEHDVAGVVKPVMLAGLTAIAGFGSLGVAHNPTLRGLGIACAIGLSWSLAATLFFTLPAAAAAEPNAALE